MGGPVASRYSVSLFSVWVWPSASIVPRTFLVQTCHVKTFSCTGCPDVFWRKVSASILNDLINNRRTKTFAGRKATRNKRYEDTKLRKDVRRWTDRDTDYLLIKCVKLASFASHLRLLLSGATSLEDAKGREVSKTWYEWLMLCLTFWRPAYQLPLHLQKLIKRIPDAGNRPFPVVLLRLCKLHSISQTQIEKMKENPKFLEW